MKKALIAGLLILALCLSMAACGGSADDPASPEAAVDLSTAAGKLAVLGFDEKDLLLTSQDSIDLDKDGDFTLHTTASYEDACKALYDACKKASDDGEVRDYWTEAPIEFSFTDEYMIWYGYNRDGEFENVAVSPIWSDQETGVTDYLLQWH